MIYAKIMIPSLCSGISTYKTNIQSGKAWFQFTVHLFAFNSRIGTSRSLGGQFTYTWHGSFSLRNCKPEHPADERFLTEFEVWDERICTLLKSIRTWRSLMERVEWREAESLILWSSEWGKRPGILHCPCHNEKTWENIRIFPSPIANGILGCGDRVNEHLAAYAIPNSGNSENAWDSKTMKKRDPMLLDFQLAHFHWRKHEVGSEFCGLLSCSFSLPNLWII